MAWRCCGAWARGFPSDTPHGANDERPILLFVPTATSKSRSAKKPPKASSASHAVAAPTTTITHDKGHTARIWIGDCRDILPRLPEVRDGRVDLVFADPPFNWKRKYDRWDDNLAEDDYLTFTFDWIDLCCRALKPAGSMWINIPDTWAAEIVCYLKGRLHRKPAAKMTLVNWCVWHYRFGQNATERFINSKVHALYFCKNPDARTWNPGEILEASDRATTYFDPRTQSKKDGMPPGLRVPLDVWYGQYWGRVQGNNTERRAYHDNQLPEVYLDRVIRVSSNPGDLVLDPFLGSGTTGVVAHALGRQFIGTEFSPENAASAITRIKAGPVRNLGGMRGVSSALRAPRRTRPRA